MVEVFKTNVMRKAAANRLIAQLALLFPGSRVNFDLEDCDKVLRVEGLGICSEKTITLLQGEGYECLELV